MTPCCRCQNPAHPTTWLDGLGPICACCRLVLAPEIDAAGIWRPREAPEHNGHHVTYQIRTEDS